MISYHHIILYYKWKELKSKVELPFYPLYNYLFYINNIAVKILIIMKIIKLLKILSQKFKKNPSIQLNGLTFDLHLHNNIA